MLEVMAIKVSTQFFLPFSGDVSAPTNVIIHISVAPAVLSMAGLLMVTFIFTCMYIKRKRKKNIGMFMKGHFTKKTKLMNGNPYLVHFGNILYSRECTTYCDD